MLPGGHIPFRKTMVVFFDFEAFERESCERVIFDFPFIIFIDYGNSLVYIDVITSQ